MNPTQHAAGRLWRALMPMVLLLAAAPLPARAQQQSGLTTAFLVKDINTDADWTGSNPQNFVTSGTVAFFTANDSAYGTEFWRSDGTANGTVLIKDICPGVESSYPRFLVNNHGTIYFGSLKFFVGNFWVVLGRAIVPEGAGRVKDKPLRGAATPHP